MSNNRYLREFHSNLDANERIVIFPHAGGSASYYFQLSRVLKKELSPSVVQYPKRAERLRDIGVETLQKLATEVVDELVADDRPLHVLGHSMGALVAWEVAQILDRHPGTELKTLFVSGCASPHRVSFESVNAEDDISLVEEISRLSGTDSSLLSDPAVLEMVLPALRHDYALLSAYIPSATERISSRIVAYSGDNDPLAPPAAVQHWHALTRSSFETRVFPGTHFYLREHNAAVGEDILARSAGAQ